MPDDALQERSQQLASRVDALAAALHEAGVSESVSAQLLATASKAVLQALTLELLFAPQPLAVPAAEPKQPAETEVPLAA